MKTLTLTVAAALALIAQLSAQTPSYTVTWSFDGVPIEDVATYHYLLIMDAQPAVDIGQPVCVPIGASVNCQRTVPKDLGPGTHLFTLLSVNGQKLSPPSEAFLYDPGTVPPKPLNLKVVGSFTVTVVSP